MSMFADFLNDEAGATAIEYGLIAVFIAIVLVAVLPAVMDKLTATYTSISGALS